MKKTAKNAEEIREGAAHGSEAQHELNGMPPSNLDIAATLHRGWINLKNAVTGASDEEILAASRTEYVDPYLFECGFFENEADYQNQRAKSIIQPRRQDDGVFIDNEE